MLAIKLTSTPEEAHRDMKRTSENDQGRHLLDFSSHLTYPSSQLHSLSSSGLQNNKIWFTARNSQISIRNFSSHKWLNGRSCTLSMYLVLVLSCNISTLLTNNWKYFLSVYLMHLQIIVGYFMFLNDLPSFLKIQHGRYILFCFHVVLKNNNF